MNPYTTLTNELDQLESLHVGTVYAYKHARIALREKLDRGELTAGEPAWGTLRGFPPQVPIAPDIRSLRQRLRVWYQRTLRELVLIRAVTALEVYLADSVRQAFVRDPQILASQDQIKITYGQLLTFRSVGDLRANLINRDLRSLHSGGLQKFKSYYRGKLKIDLESCGVDFRRIQEIHDRRHILVHRLGRTDTKYRRDYQVKAKHIEVGRTYLNDAFALIRGFALGLQKELRKVKSRNWFPAAPTGRGDIKVKAVSRSGRLALDPSYVFEHDDNLILLRDLIVERSVVNDVFTLRIEGSVHQIRNYCSRLHTLAEISSLTELETLITRLGRGRHEGMFDEFISSVASDLLDIEAIPDGFRRLTAEKHGTRLRRVAEALVEIRLARSIVKKIGPPPWTSGVHVGIARELNMDQRYIYKVLGRISRGVYAHHVPILIS